MTVVQSAPTRPLSPVAKSRLAVEILHAYARVRWSMRRANLLTVIDTLTAAGPRSPSRPVLADGAGDGLRLGRAVVRTIAPLPSGSVCLLRSLILLRILARRGIRGDLVIAVRPDTQPQLDAHAWIEVDGEPLLNPAHDFGRLVKL